MVFIIELSMCLSLEFVCSSVFLEPKPSVTGSLVSFSCGENSL